LRLIHAGHNSKVRFVFRKEISSRIAVSSAT
jgi:hypothetical protein